MPQRDPYSVFAVPTDASHEDIRSVFRGLSKIYHPDADTGNAEKFKELSEAYEILGNPERRAAYDRDRATAPHRGTGTATSPERDSREAEFDDLWEQAEAAPKVKPEAPPSGSSAGATPRSTPSGPAHNQTPRPSPAALEAAYRELLSCTDPATIAQILRDNGAQLPHTGDDLRKPFSILAGGGRLKPPTHGLHQMRLALPMISRNRAAIDASAFDHAWETSPGHFISTDGDGFDVTLSFSGNGYLEKRLLNGEIPNSYGDPWVGTGTSFPTGTAAVPVGDTAQIVRDPSVHGTKQRLASGVMVRSYSRVRISEMLQLLR